MPNNNKNQYLTREDLDGFFMASGNVYYNQNAVCLQLTDELTICKTIWDLAPVIFYLEVVAKDDGTLGQRFNLKRWSDLMTVDETKLWEHYRNGTAIVRAGLERLFDMDICFEQREGRTYIYSDLYEKGYADVVEELPDDLEWFRAYIRDHVRDFYVIAEERNVIV